MTHINLIRHFHTNLVGQPELARSAQTSIRDDRMALVDQSIYPGCTGRVRYRGTYWFGVCSNSRMLPKGSEVIVTGRNGNTLLVEPILACML